MFWDSLKIKVQDVKVYQKRFGLHFVELIPYFEETPTARGSAMERGIEPYTFNYAYFAGDKFKVALTICWEQMYPHRMAELVNDDAEFVALTNNGCVVWHFGWWKTTFKLYPTPCHRKPPKNCSMLKWWHFLLY